jgi:hypothetical protein
VTNALPASLRSVAIPSEHGGWSLTLEPALLGLIVAPSPAGFALAAAALVGFLLRTPLRVVLVDRFRDRRLGRTGIAARLAAGETAVLAALIAVAFAAGEPGWWVPMVPAGALIAIEIWYDIRSRSRRLVPELAGTVGIGAIAAAIALAGGAATAVAYGLWLVIAARAVSAVFFVRLQLRRAKGQPHRVWISDVAQVVTGVAVFAGVALDSVPVAGAGAVTALALVHGGLSRTTPPRAAILGSQQVVFGLTVVLITGLAAIAP